jgi:tetratricopeptide (TPR) repeat protein
MGSFGNKKYEEKPLSSEEDDLENANAWLKKGFAAAEKGSHEEALHCYDKALDIDPTLLEAGYRRGLSFYYMGDYRTAMACFDRVLKVESSHAEAWLMKGLCMDLTGIILIIEGINFRSKSENKGEAIGAEECYDKALELNPKLFLAWINKGGKLISQATKVTDKVKSEELYQNGLECCNKALELAPEFDQSWKVWINKGAALQGLGKYLEALECYDKSLEIRPNDGMAWRGIGLTWQDKARCFEKLESYQEALECTTEALERIRDIADIWYCRGFYLERLKNFKEAIKCYEKTLELELGALEMEPKSKPYNILFDVGVNLERLGSFQKAKKALEEFIISNPLFSSNPKIEQARDIIKKIQKMKLK